MAISKARSRLLRILLALAIVYWLVTQAGIDAVLGQLRHAQSVPIALALMAMTGEVSFRALTWHLLLRATCAAQSIRYSPLLSIYLGSALVGSFVPSSAGVDVIRAGMSQRTFGGHFATHAASVVMQNGMSFFVACLLGLQGLAFLWVQSGIPQGLIPVALALSSVAIGVPLVYVVLRVRRGLLLISMRRLGRRWFGLRRSLRRFFDAVFVFERAHARLGRILLASAAALLCQSLAYGLFGAALGIALPIGAWILLPSVIAIAALLPATFLGFGAIQAANVYILTACGAPLADSVAVATLVAVMNIAFRAISGGMAMVFWPSRQVDEMTGGSRP
jgi:uncharacterized membrane protein YbhN (UPF0104 family)